MRLSLKIIIQAVLFLGLTMSSYAANTDNLSTYQLNQSETITPLLDDYENPDHWTSIFNTSTAETLPLPDSFEQVLNLPKAKEELLFIFDIHGVLLEANWMEVDKLWFELMENEYNIGTSFKTWLENNMKIATPQFIQELSEKSGKHAYDVRNEIERKQFETKMMQHFNIDEKQFETFRQKAIVIFHKKLPNQYEGSFKLLSKIKKKGIPILIVSKRNRNLVVNELRETHFLNQSLNEDIVIGGDTIRMLIGKNIKRNKLREAFITYLNEKYPNHTIAYFNDQIDGMKTNVATGGINFGIFSPSSILTAIYDYSRGIKSRYHHSSDRDLFKNNDSHFLVENFSEDSQNRIIEMIEQQFPFYTSENGSNIEFSVSSLISQKLEEKINHSSVILNIFTKKWESLQNKLTPDLIQFNSWTKKLINQIALKATNHQSSFNNIPIIVIGGDSGAGKSVGAETIRKKMNKHWKTLTNKKYPYISSLLIRYDDFIPSHSIDGFDKFTYAANDFQATMFQLFKLKKDVTMPYFDFSRRGRIKIGIHNEKQLAIQLGEYNTPVAIFSLDHKQTGFEIEGQIVPILKLDSGRIQLSLKSINANLYELTINDSVHLIKQEASQVFKIKLGSKSKWQTISVDKPIDRLRYISSQVNEDTFQYAIIEGFAALDHIPSEIQFEAGYITGDQSVLLIRRYERFLNTVKDQQTADHILETQLTHMQSNQTPLFGINLDSINPDKLTTQTVAESILLSYLKGEKHFFSLDSLQVNKRMLWEELSKIEKPMNSTSLTLETVKYNKKLLEVITEQLQSEQLYILMKSLLAISSKTKEVNFQKWLLAYQVLFYNYQDIEYQVIDFIINKFDTFKDLESETQFTQNVYDYLENQKKEIPSYIGFDFNPLSENIRTLFYHWKTFKQQSVTLPLYAA